VPETLRRKFHAIKSRFREAPFHLKRIYLAVGEEPIASALDDAVAKFPALLLGSYPSFDRPDYRVLLTLESKDLRYLTEAHAYLLARLPQGAVVRLDDGSPHPCRNS
jgi:hypothetical protein